MGRKLYEDLSFYRSPQVPPILSWQDYQWEMKQYALYYRENFLHGVWLLLGVKLWSRVTRLKKFVKTIDTSERDKEFQTADKAVGLRLPLPMLSFIMVLKDDPTKKDLLSRASSLILAAKNFHQDFLAGKISQDFFKDYPLEMGQYDNFFSTSLHFGNPDKIVKSLHKNEIIVMLRGEFYALQLKEENNSYSQIYATLEKIMQIAANQLNSRGQGVGTLTYAERNFVNLEFEKLMLDPQNSKSYQRINEAYFIVNLQEEKMTGKNPGEIGHFMFVQDSDNRWAHHSLQLIVCEDGTSGIMGSNRNYIDGNTAIRFAQEIQRRGEKVIDQKRVGPLEETLPLESLNWNILASDVVRWKHHVQQFLNDKPQYFTINGMGKNDFLGLGITADNAFTFALYLASQKIFKRPLNIIQIVNMSMYRFMGLAHCFLSTTSLKKLSSLLDKNCEQKILKLALNEAIIEHRKRQQRARKGMIFIHVAHYFLSLGGKKQGLILKFFGKIFSLSRAKPDVLISNPRTEEEITAVGRPGVYLSFCRYYGLHYSILKDSLWLLYMPSQQQKNYPFDELSKLIERYLHIIRNILIS